MNAPSTYGEWTNLLDQAGDVMPGRDMLAALSAGSLAGGPDSARRLLERIAEFEDRVLKRLLQNLERNFAMLPANTSAEDVVILVRRFSTSCDDLMFFRGLTFIPQEHREELDSAVTAQVAHVLGQLLRHMECESGPGAMDDVVFYVDRLRDRWLKGGCVGQLC